MRVLKCRFDTAFLVLTVHERMCKILTQERPQGAFLNYIASSSADSSSSSMSSSISSSSTSSSPTGAPPIISSSMIMATKTRLIRPTLGQQAPLFHQTLELLQASATCSVDSGRKGHKYQQLSRPFHRLGVFWVGAKADVESSQSLHFYQHHHSR